MSTEPIDLCTVAETLDGARQDLERAVLEILTAFEDRTGCLITHLEPGKTRPDGPFTRCKVEISVRRRARDPDKAKWHEYTETTA